MATVMNDRDVLLLGTSQRATNPQTATILLTSDSPAFHVSTTGVTTPSYITVTAHLLGIVGTAHFTATGATITDNNDGTATIAYNGMSGASATITATITSNGQTFTASTTLAKIQDGATGQTGSSGSPGNQYAIAYLYQWSTTAPANPTGTSNYNWTNGSNTGYVTGDGWSVSVPSNPGTPNIKLYVAAIQISAAGGTTSSSVSYASAVVQAWAQNGATGPQGNAGVSGMQSATATVYQWAATIPAGPSGTSTYTWNGGAISSVPSGWSTTSGTSPSLGMTLWAAKVYITDSATNTTTNFNWTSASISAVGYAGTNGTNGATGTQGASYVTAYCASATTSTTTAPAQTTGKTSLPATNDGGIVGTWVATVPTLVSGQFLYQSDGIYDPTTNKVTWSIPYWSSLKVGSLSAITANLGAINAGSINIGSGTAVINSDGSATFKNITINSSGGSTLIAPDGSGTVNNAIVDASTKATWVNIIGAGKPQDNANYTSASKGAALNDDPCIENLPSWTLSANVFKASDAGSGAVAKTYLGCSSGTDQLATQVRRFPIDPNKTYDFNAMLYANSGNNRNIYLYINFYDSSGSRVFASPTWGGTMSGYVFGGIPPLGWSRQGRWIGAGTVCPIPSSVKEAEVGVWFQYSGSGSSQVVQACQDLRIEDVTLSASALVQLSAIANDSILSKGEKSQAILDWNAADAEWTALISQADNLAVDRTAYNTSHQTLSTYLLSLSPSWTDTTQDTSIVATTWRANWTSYYSERQKLINAIAAKASTMASGVTISSNGTLNNAGGGQVTLPGMGLNTYRVITQGNSRTATLPAPVGFYINGVVQSGTNIARSYTVIVLSRSTGAIISATNYDVYGVGEFNGRTAATMATDLNALASDKIVVVMSYDEPQAHRLDSGLDTAMYRCGASRTIYGSSQFKIRSAYVLVGIPGCGEGNGAEAYQGSVDNDVNAWVDIGFNITNGTLAGVSTYYKPKSLTDYGYTGDLNATNGATLGVNVSGQAPSLSALSPTIGTYSSSPSGGRVVITDGVIKVYDTTGAVRIKLGNLSL